MSEMPAVPPATLAARLREKLPEIVIETSSVLLALVLAFGAGAWHEHAQQQELAEQARAAIRAEMKENAVELDKLRARLKTTLATLQATAARPKDAAGDSLTIDMSLALLSEAAWRAALASGAVQHFDYAWTARTAKIYELQELTLRAQSSAADQLIDVTDADKESAHDIALRLLGRQRALSQLADGLDRSYREVLADPHDGVAP